ncbi:hypothetical protein P154DRAFT_56037 [Amniculicola lignicola CBS 123094]|uniref:Uncharacterized protein n=1 Tax=Amniculicola lignicola CBS 123094 TaxID=1392246 RepID=A0A6A5WYZ7_9PLEO|nr:hypothetical protein P154DRAFT_56037 [Amniculicola lignicola CBS 123094]
MGDFLRRPLAIPLRATLLVCLFLLLSQSVAPVRRSSLSLLTLPSMEAEISTLHVSLITPIRSWGSTAQRRDMLSTCGVRLLSCLLCLPIKQPPPSSPSGLWPPRHTATQQTRHRPERGCVWGLFS